MENKRLFISLPIDPQLTAHLHKQFVTLNIPHQKLKPVYYEQLHLTIKFLGETPLEKIDPLISVLEEASKNVGGFELEIDKVQIFPPNKNRPPRILAISFKPNKELQLLFNQVEDNLFQAGLAHKENRKYTPHLTMARVKQAAKFEEFAEFINWPVTGNFFVNQLELQESVLKRTGPQYIVLNSFEL